MTGDGRGNRRINAGYTTGDTTIANNNTVTVYNVKNIGYLQGGFVSSDENTTRDNWGNGNAIGNVVNITAVQFQAIFMAATFMETAKSTTTKFTFTTARL